ncbi:hypothetical protein BDV95DRAFT_484994 [Massariosphaeria phaeospora]|uniref:Homeobox domain-containing protein n=1 Tax=Massariosphaeria phaeospora TaxID=100035 RepID=A0A7C8MEI4_9PLEO|nr:hypothetical protein BDV95DRAFT_484994 [Massariosphaeria phaeospora]
MANTIRQPVARQPPSRASTVGTRKPASAKRKGPQTRIPLEARQMLEEEFATNPYPCNWELDIIAHQANLEVKKVRNWFNNQRARKKPCEIPEGRNGLANADSRSLASRLSRESLEAIDKEADEVPQAPQPPLAKYLAQSYYEEAATYSDIQAAMDHGSPSDRSDSFLESWSGTKAGRSGSVVTSLTSSDGTAPTAYTISSSGSNISSFGRDRRRGRRRMAWRASPYTRPIVSGLNDAGVPQKDLPFFCTFCPRAFKTKYEWIRHEDSVHALRTTWICCDTKNIPLQSCPFCGLMHPSEQHLTTHKYQQCRNKPESQRTFYRRDHFVQHLHHVHFANVKHPSARLGCQARLMASEGHHFGCKDLALHWRRFGAPIKSDDPMLHCGFCGKRSKDWSERCDHVAEHLVTGGIDRSAWWSERSENHMESLLLHQIAGPFRCRYCQKVFADTDAMNEHSHCRVWSCRFLRTADDIASENSGPPLCPQFPSPKAHHCHLCGAGYRGLHAEHAQNYHRHRLCKQEMYTSEADFLQHLHNFHGASQPQLLQNSSIIEQNFSRNKGASFESVNLDEAMGICRIATPGTRFAISLADGERITPTISTREQPVQSMQQLVPPSKSVPHEPVDKSSKAQRQRSNTTALKSSHDGPRFFRFDPRVPFFSARIYYSHSARSVSAPKDGSAVLEEMPKSHIASLVMTSGLVSMAGLRWPINIKKNALKGTVELALDKDDGGND